MMVVEDKEGWRRAREVAVSFTVRFQTSQHTTGAHGWARLGFILIFNSFLLLFATGKEGGDPIWVIERVAPTSPLV